ncbi:MAG: hypothetical protein KDI15_08480 [Thiothrix sp.]|nr:hypothetical protein [Thiothrix sp.]HPE61560.1 hypothetical protein [Thiolinea sp.]
MLPASPLPSCPQALDVVRKGAPEALTRPSQVQGVAVQGFTTQWPTMAVPGGGKGEYLFGSRLPYYYENRAARRCR